MRTPPAAASRVRARSHHGRFFVLGLHAGLSLILNAVFSGIRRSAPHAGGARRIGAGNDCDQHNADEDRITMPGTFSRPKPKYHAHDEAASTTPGMVPEPPRMLTPPRTTMVTISRFPAEGDGRTRRTQPGGEADRGDARHEPGQQDRMNFTARRAPRRTALRPGCCRSRRPSGRNLSYGEGRRRAGRQARQHEFEGKHPPDIALSEIGEIRGIAGERLVARMM